MTSIIPTPDGKFRAFIQRVGFPKQSKTFATKTAARQWGRAIEAKIDRGENPAPKVPKDTVEALVKRYIKEECAAPEKKWDKLRLEAFLVQAKALSKKPAARVTHDDFELWVAARKKQVSEATALRELNVVSGMFTHAMKVWKVKLPAHPTRGMIKPKKGKPRNRRPTQSELQTLSKCRGGANRYTLKWYVLWMFELAIETGMRIGEMVKIKPGDLHLDEHWLHLPKTKNGDARDVPLSPRAAEILEAMMQRPEAAKKGPMALNKGSLDTVWRDTCADLGIADLHFHDSRHEACTRLAKVYEVLDLAKIIGHRDLKSLMIYYNPTPQELARRLRPGAAAATPPQPTPPTAAS